MDYSRLDVVICSGMPRSASTWSFNAAKRLIGVKARASGWIKESLFGDGAEIWQHLKARETKAPRHLVIKSHLPPLDLFPEVASGAVKNIYTCRDPRDAVASRRLFADETFADSLGLILASLELSDRMAEAGGTLFLKYEEVTQDPAAALTRMASYLGAKPGPQDLDAILKATSPEAVAAIARALSARPRDQLTKVRDHLVDPASQVHHNHLQGGEIGRFRKELTADEQNILSRAFAPWLAKLGYA